MGRLGVILIAVAVGTVMYWAVTTQGTGLRVSTVGVVLIAGGAGLVASMIVFATSRRLTGNRRHAQPVDSQRRPTQVHEEMH
jgi:hypothetical protein